MKKYFFSILDYKTYYLKSIKFCPPCQPLSQPLPNPLQSPLKKAGRGEGSFFLITKYLKLLITPSSLRGKSLTVKGFWLHQPLKIYSGGKTGRVNQNEAPDLTLGIIPISPP